jgi:SNF2 family DNA or RNA helicase
MIDPNCSDASKIEALRNVLDEVVTQNGHKALIFSQYKEMLNILSGILDEMHMKYLRIDGDTDKQLRADMQRQF